MIADHIGLLPPTDLSFLSEFISELVDKEGPQHLLLNESQGPLLGLLFIGWKNFGNLQEIEKVFGLYISDHWSTGGFILNDKCNEEQILEHLKARAEQRSQKVDDGIARPNTTLPILMLSASALGLEDLIEPYLSELNGLYISIFIPSNGNDFGAKTIRTGCNLTKKVGTNLYSCSSYLQEMAGDIVGYDNTDIYSLRGFVKCLATFVWRDRFPLYVSPAK